jgi:hypothetical protein
MGRRPRRRPDDGISDSETSDVSFQMDSDETNVGLDSVTDMTDSDAPTPSRDTKPPGHGRRQRRRGRACVTELTGPSRPSAPSSSTARLRVSSSTTREPDTDAAFRLDEKDFDQSSDDSDSDPDVETDGELSDDDDDDDDDGYSDSVKEGKLRMRERWER